MVGHFLSHAEHPNLEAAAKRRTRKKPTTPESIPKPRGKLLLETHLDLIQRKLHHLSRRSGLPELDAEEFRSWAVLKLVENDYRILSSWEERSSFPTFLTVVLTNLMRDYRIHVLGKWRACTASRRKGKEGILLERFCVRDGLSLEEAAARMRTEHGIALSPADLERLAADLPRRKERRRRVDEEELLEIPVDGQVEIRIEERERTRTAARVRELLLPLLESLPAEDRLLLKLSFFDGLSMAAISPILGRPQRELFSTRDRCLKKIRRALEAAGLRFEEMREIIGGFQECLGLERHLGAQ